MRMRVGDLYNLLEEVKEAEEAVEQARERLLNGGDEAAVQRKRKAVDDAEMHLFDLREREIEL